MPISPASATQLFAIAGSQSKESNPTTDDEAVTPGTQKAFRPGTVVFPHPSTRGGYKGREWVPTVLIRWIIEPYLWSLAPPIPAMLVID
jgi:hypothetical protein